VFEPPFVPTKPGILPVPVDAKPIAGFVFVQVNELFDALLVEMTAEVFVFAHTNWFAIGESTGTGFTVTLNDVGEPKQVSP
jgi:hypothetical protein